MVREYIKTVAKQSDHCKAIPVIIGVFHYCCYMNYSYPRKDEHIAWIDFFFVLSFFRAEPMADGASQARGQIGAVAMGLHHSHSNAESDAGQIRFC